MVVLRLIKSDQMLDLISATLNQCDFIELNLKIHENQRFELRIW